MWPHRGCLVLVEWNKIWQYVIYFEVYYKWHRRQGLSCWVGSWYKAYPGLGNRSIFFSGSSVGSTITFGIVEDRSSNPTSNISLKEILARASYCKHVSLGLQDLDRSLGRHVRPYTETSQPIRPKDIPCPPWKRFFKTAYWTSCQKSVTSKYILSKFVTLVP